LRSNLEPEFLRVKGTEVQGAFRVST